MSSGNMDLVTSVIVGLICCRWAMQQWLEWINRRHVSRSSTRIPAGLEGVMNSATYARSVAYTLAKSRVQQFEIAWDAVVLCVALFSSVLPRGMEWFQSVFGNSTWSMAGYLFTVGLAVAMLGLPWSWHDQFVLEERFGFNNSTQRIWWMDRLKGLLLALLLGYPLIVLLLKLVEWTGPQWWVWGWGTMLVFQLLISVLAPVLILPLFNKLTPLPEGTLRERLLKMAEKTRFRAQNIQVMDGSKRSRHSNAFFTGFGKFRKIVLFDTLVEQLAEPEVEAVLAHEIGHYKRKHIPKMLAFSTASSFAGFWALSVLAKQEWFYRSFGFEVGNIAAALLLFAFLSGLVSFWFSPLMHVWSRKYEYEADAFARAATGEPAPLIEALQKLNRENLSNMNPHPAYSGFYYSHPTLVERERALAGR